MSDFEQAVKKAFLAWENELDAVSIDEKLADFRERQLTTTAAQRADASFEEFMKHFVFP